MDQFPRLFLESTRKGLAVFSLSVGANLVCIGRG